MHYFDIDIFNILPHNIRVLKMSVERKCSLIKNTLVPKKMVYGDSPACYFEVWAMH